MSGRVFRVAVAALLAAAAVPRAVHAYETNVHEKLSQAAFYAAQVQRNPDVFKRLGLSASSVFPNSNDEPLSIFGLVSYGSIHEDDNARPLNHFFDPITGRGLLPISYPSPDWALEDRGALDGPFWIQAFSFRDARKDLYDALTSAKKSDRDVRFGHLFEALGRAIHHVQDMAQPQHVRNDPHLDSPFWNTICPLPIGPICGAYGAIRNPSAYERYTRDHPDRAEPTTGYPSVYPGPTPSTWSLPRDFWQSGGLGLAEYTNRNFVSAGTNFETHLYASPAFDIARKKDYTIAELCALFPGTPCPGVDGTLTMFGTTVTDSFTGASVSNDYASTLSLFDADLAAKGKSYVFSLNRFNFEATLRFVIPRAVGYSAGLLDYFFRGDVDLVEDPDSRGFLLRNASPDALSGAFALYYDGTDGVRRPVPGAKWTRVLAGTPDPTKPVSSDAVTFAPPADPETPGRYVLVFSGDEGQEVAGGGSVGSVIGRIVNVRHVPEGLFVAGLDAQGKTVYLRADASGTHVLAVGDFNPLAPTPPPAGGSQGGGTRLYKMKQVSFSGPAPGYLTVGLALLNQPLGGGQFYVGATLVYDPKLRGYAYVNEPSWLATSPDPALGRFVFTYHVASGAITYQRVYVDAGGVTRSASGLVTIPPALTSYDFVGLSDIDRGKVFVAPDGLSLKGFVKTLGISSTTTPTGTGSTTVSSMDRVEGELVFTLAAVPTASLVETTVRQLNARIDRGQFQLQIGTYSTHPPLSCFNPIDIDAFTCTFPELHFYDSWVSHQDQNQSTPIGWFDGALARYGWTYRFDVNDVTDYTGANCSMSACEPPAVCCAPSQGWIRVEYSGAIDNRQEQDGSFTFTDGGFPAIQNPQTHYEDKTLHYEGCRDDGPVFAPPTSTFSYFEQTILRALTANGSDALISSRNTNNGGFHTLFRGMDLTGLSYAADASPIGEVFFATTDMAVVIHEPKGGRMPPIVIPPNVVKIIGAIWM